MIKVVLVFMTFLFFPGAIAQANDHENIEYRILHEYEISESESAYLVATENGHLLGQPFQVELRVRCGEAKGNIKDLPVKDSFSVCDLNPSSVKINNQKTALALQTKAADLNAYYDQVGEGVKSPEVSCESKTTVKKFSLRDLCSH